MTTSAVQSLTVPVSQQFYVSTAIDQQMPEIMPLGRIIAHEMRHYLSVLMEGIVHLRKFPAGGLENDLNTLEAATRNMDSLTDALRYSCKNPRFECINLPELLWEQLAFAESMLSLHHITLAADIPAISISVFADPHQLGRCILNLVINAIEACQNGGSVFIECWESDLHVHITIRDTGTGMTPEQLSMMWTPLFTTKSTGTGLGAYMARQIIINHGGSVHAESLFGRGTTINIDLPLSTSLFN